MKNILFSVCLFTFFIAGLFVSAQSNQGLYIDTSYTQTYEWDMVKIGFPTQYEEEYSQGKTLPDSTIQLDTISKKKYLKYWMRSISYIDTDTSALTYTDSTFTIHTPETSLTYFTNRICECSASYYDGLIRPLNLYIVNTVDMHNEIAYSVFIDRKTGKIFHLPSDADEGPSDILLSPAQQHLLVYYNSGYEHDNCGVYIMQVKKQGYQYRLENKLVILFDRLNILDLVWISERAFAMKLSEQYDPEDYDRNNRLFYYLKVTLPE